MWWLELAQNGYRGGKLGKLGGVIVKEKAIDGWPKLYSRVEATTNKMAAKFVTLTILPLLEIADKDYGCFQ